MYKHKHIYTYTLICMGFSLFKDFKYSLNPMWGSNSQSKDQESHGLLTGASQAPLISIFIIFM